jgi:hypothetical protein
MFTLLRTCVCVCARIMKRRAMPATRELLLLLHRQGGTTENLLSLKQKNRIICQ